MEEWVNNKQRILHRGTQMYFCERIKKNNRKKRGRKAKEKKVNIWSPSNWSQTMASFV